MHFFGLHFYVNLGSCFCLKSLLVQQALLCFCRQGIPLPWRSHLHPLLPTGSSGIPKDTMVITGPCLPSVFTMFHSSSQVASLPSYLSGLLFHQLSVVIAAPSQGSLQCQVWDFSTWGSRWLSTDTVFEGWRRLESKSSLGHLQDSKWSSLCPTWTWPFLSCSWFSWAIFSLRIRQKERKESKKSRQPQPVNQKR